MDLATGQGFTDLVMRGPFDAVINCAAISQPGVCEQSPDVARYGMAWIHITEVLLLLHLDDRFHLFSHWVLVPRRAVNVPTRFPDLPEQQRRYHGLEALLVHLSTD